MFSRNSYLLFPVCRVSFLTNSPAVVPYNRTRCQAVLSICMHRTSALSFRDNEDSPLQFIKLGLLPTFSFFRYESSYIPPPFISHIFRLCLSPYPILHFFFRITLSFIYFIFSSTNKLLLSCL